MKTVYISLMLFLVTVSLNAQWELSNGPWYGSVNSFYKINNDIYAATADDFFYTSSDNGRKWFKGSSVGITNANMKCFLSDGTYTFAGTDGGVFLSIDNGMNWFAINNGLGSPSVIHLIQTDSVIIAVTSYGLYSTADKGTTWIQMGFGLSGTLTSFLIHNNNYYCGTDQGIFKSTDKGSTWIAANFGLISQNVRSLTAIGNTIYAGSSANTGAAAVYKSTNNGSTWLSSGLTNQQVNALYYFDSKLYAGTNSGFYRSTDLGVSWSNELDNTKKKITSFISSGNNLIAGSDEGIFLSINGGTVWYMTGYLPVQVWSMDANINDIYVTAYRPKMFVSTNNGESWLQRIPAYMDPTYRYTTMKAFDGTAYSGYINNDLTKTGIITTTDKGLNWIQGMWWSNRSIYAIAADFNGLRYAGFYKKTGNYGLFNFQGISAFYGDGVWDIAIQDSIVYVATFDKGVGRTTNNGITWSTSGPTSVRKLRTYITTVYAIGDAVYRSTDYGITWDNIGLAGKTIQSFAVDQNSIIAGVPTEGFYVTSNGGQTWQLKNDGIEGATFGNLNTLVINNGFVFASVDDKSVWKRSLRSLVDVNDANSLPPVQFALEQNYPNPFNPLTNISFSLSEKGNVSLKIYDILGKEVAILFSEEMDAGKHLVTWNAKNFSSGVYFYQLKAGNFIETKKLLLTK